MKTNGKQELFSDGQQTKLKGHPIYLQMLNMVSELRQELMEALQLNEILLNSIVKQPTQKGSTKSGSGNSQDNGISDKKDPSPKEQSDKEQVLIVQSKKKRKTPKIQYSDKQSEYIPFPTERNAQGNIPRDSKEDTKNVVKTIITAICNYLSDNSVRVRKSLNERKFGKNYAEFCKFNNKLKNQVCSLADLRRIWSVEGLSDSKLRSFKQVFRIFSFQYLRCKFMSHIFESSRIKNKKLYMKVRTKLLQGIFIPEQLCNLKDY